MAVKRYRYDILTALEAGVREHPQDVIKRYAPDAHEWQPAPLAECWLFSAAPIENPPDFIVDVSGEP